MDNNELDKILKSKLKDKIKPSADLEGKIRQKVEQEKMNQLKSMNTENNNNKNKKYKKIRTLISMVAVILIVFAVGMNLDTIPNILQSTTEIANIKAIEPTKTLNGILASDSDFIIYADNTNIESVQKSLYVEPALEYTIKKQSDNTYKLTFKQNIPDNTIVKLQYVKNKITEDSWAYQTSNKLSISSTYPDNGITYASKNTTIEIKFSYASVEDLEKNVQITPNVDGKWEHLGKIWRFTPEKALKDDKTYSVKINKGIKAEGQTLEEDYIFSFTVDSLNEETKYTHNKTSIDGIENAKSNELVKIHYNTDGYTTSKTKISKVEISKFKTGDEFIDYIKTGAYKNVEKLGEYKFTQEQYYLQLTKTLQTGYYIATVKDQNNNELFNCPIQINDLSAYAIQTERDIIAWVAEGNELAKNIKVEYLGKTEKTNSQGIAELKGILDGTKTIKYLKIGNSKNQLIVGVYNYEQATYPHGYIYTDRPLYKNTDTINIWGFVPRQLFYDKIDENEFYIQLGNEEKQKIKVDETGSFTHKIELKNHIDMEYTDLTLHYKDAQIAYRNLTIENYELQNYIYNVIMDKNYGYNGEKFDFQVKVEHITGLSVPNKSVVVEYKDEIYRGTTNENGIAKFSLKLEEDDEDTTITAYREIAIYNGDLEEYTDSEEYIDITVLSRNTYTETESYGENNKYKVTLYKLSENKNALVTYGLEEIYEGKYNTEVKVNLIEKVQKRYISGYNYNEYTKENEPEYSYEILDESNKLIETIKTQNGTAEFDANKLNFKKDTEEIEYIYHLEFIYKDRNNKEVKESFYLSNNDEYESHTLGYSTGWEFNSCGLGNVPTDIDYESYDIYRYFFKQDSYNFDIGDTVKLSLAESTENGIKDLTNQGKILRFIFKENVTKTQIIEDNNLDYTFTEKDFPGCGMTSAYFVNGKFYRMPIYYFDFNEENRKVDVEITSDKKEYKPRDKVTLTVKTTNKGNPIKSTVNVSVINKAVFELQEDFTYILNDIYENKYYNVYTYSTYKDFIDSEGGGGGGRKRRSKRRLWRHSMFRNRYYKLKRNCTSNLYLTR